MILDQLHVIDSHIFQELTILSVLNSSPKKRNHVKNSTNRELIMPTFEENLRSLMRALDQA
jgi:hypothetical protein